MVITTIDGGVSSLPAIGGEAGGCPPWHASRVMQRRKMVEPLDLPMAMRPQRIRGERRAPCFQSRCDLHSAQFFLGEGAAVAAVGTQRASFLLVAGLATIPTVTTAQPTPVGGEFQVNAYATGDQNGSAAMNANGQFLVTWGSEGQDGSEVGIFARRYNSSGTAQAAEFQVNAYTGGDQFRPVAGMEADGDFVIAWVDDSRDGQSAGVFARRFDSSGTPKAPRLPGQHAHRQLPGGGRDRGVGGRALRGGLGE